MSWHTNKLMPLWHHWAFWNTGLLKWPHRVIRGSKIKSVWIWFKSISDRQPWLKNSKNVIIFQMRHMVLTLGVVKGQRLVFRLYRGQKTKLLRFSWKWWHIVRLPRGIQKKNSLHYLQRLLHMFFDQNVTGHHSANGNKPFLHHILVTWHFVSWMQEGRKCIFSFCGKSNFVLRFPLYFIVFLTSCFVHKNVSALSWDLYHNSRCATLDVLSISTTNLISPNMSLTTFLHSSGYFR